MLCGLTGVGGFSGLRVNRGAGEGNLWIAFIQRLGPEQGIQRGRRLALLLSGKAEVVPRPAMAWVKFHRFGERLRRLRKIDRFVPGKPEFVMELRFAGVQSNGCLQLAQRVLWSI